MAFPAPKMLPRASALFVPFELQHYKYWRQSALGIVDDDDDDILLPTAFEYNDFPEWRTSINTTQDVEDRTPDPAFAGFQLAERCEHPLHPGDPRINVQQQEQGEVNKEREEKHKIAWCPMCLVEIHLKLLGDLWDKWEESGGAWRILPAGCSGENFQIRKRAYYKQKTDTVNDIDDVEDIARLEAAWEAAHPAVDVEVVRAYSAKTAIAVYAKSIQFPARLAEVDQVAPRTPPRKHEKKCLSYSPDTPEDTRHRSRALYARRHPSYDPESPHRCPGDNGWAETSFNNDWEYNVRQCRLLLCDKDPKETNVTYRELTGENSKDVLIKGIEEWFSMMQGDWKASWARTLLTTTDLFVVWRSPSDTEESDNDFDNWDRLETLVGTNLEAHALRIGDLTDADIEPIQGQTLGDFFDQDSVASDSSSETDEEEHELSDSMDLRGDEDVVTGVAGQERQLDHMALRQDA